MLAAAAESIARKSSCFLDQGGLPQAQLVYDLARDQLVKAYLPDADSALSEELCLQAAQIRRSFLC